MPRPTAHLGVGSGRRCRYPTAPGNPVLRITYALRRLWLGGFIRIVAVLRLILRLAVVKCCFSSQRWRIRPESCFAEISTCRLPACESCCGLVCTNDGCDGQRDCCNASASFRSAFTVDRLLPACFRTTLLRKILTAPETITSRLSSCQKMLHGIANRCAASS